MKSSPESLLVEAIRWEQMARDCSHTDPGKVICQREAEALFIEALEAEGNN